MQADLHALLDTGRRVQWKASARIEVIDERTVLVLEDEACDVLTGDPLALLAPLLRQGRTLGELFDRLAGRLSPPEIEFALDYLAGKHLLAEATAAPPGLAAFWHQYGAHPETAEQALAAQPVRIVGSDPEDVAGMARALAELDVARSDTAGFPVVVVRDYLDDTLDGINRDMLAANQPWMLVQPSGRELLVGPVFRPGRTGCWACLAQRLQSNRQIEAFLERANISADDRAAAPLHRAARNAVAAIAAHELVKAIALGPPHDLSGTILAIDSTDMATSRHQLIRRPQCPVCGEAPPARDAAHYRLSASSTGAAHSPTGSRSVSPEATYERLKRHVSHLTGVVRSLEPVGDGARNGLTYSYTSGHNFALMQHDLRFALLNLRGRSGGKGARDIDARVGAICEAIERYSGVHRGDEPFVRASYVDLDGLALPPNDLMRFSAAQFDAREDWNREHTAGFHKVPLTFRAHDAIDWAPAWSISRQSFVHVPSAYCYFGHPDLQARFFCSCDSNGNAAGNTREEAILQGLLELVERDAVALWWYNRIRRPEIALASLQDGYVDQLAAFYAAAGRSFWLLDITSDLGIPVVAAVSRATDRSSEDIILGFGAHLDAKVAARRAIAELNQFLPAVAGKDAKGETLYWFPEPEAIRWWRTARVATEPYLLPDPAKPPQSVDAIAPPAPDDVDATLAVVLDRVHAQSLEVLVLDQTQPDVDLAVVKVMVPGLRHFWKRFGPGRLYDVPVKMGWVDRPLTEGELNPHGIFF